MFLVVGPAEMRDFFLMHQLNTTQYLLLSISPYPPVNPLLTDIPTHTPSQNFNQSLNQQTHSAINTLSVKYKKG